jgi:predicted DNA-binding helix-hairpin-helix protein
VDALEKIGLLAEFSSFELEEGQTPAAPGNQTQCLIQRDLTGPKKKINPLDLSITRVSLPNGRKMPILKTLLTSVCERNCYYCGFRSERDCRRTTFKPDELAQVYTQMYRGGVVQGLFLSSGVAGGGLKTQDRLLAAADILRNKLKYMGYLHLKIMPGAEKAQVERAMQLADRVSINLEAPSTEVLHRLAPQKQFLEELLQPLKWIEEIRTQQPGNLGWKQRWPSSCTQFVVGGGGENDLQLLATTAYLYNSLHLKRAYYSKFTPVSGTPLENQPVCNPWREHRLYQASFLLRDYGFDLEDLPFGAGGDLPLNTDPKLAWAQQNLTNHPMEVNLADLRDLLRIPGIGPQGAQAILAARRKGAIHRLEELRAMGIIDKRAAPFILLGGKQPVQQLKLF